MLYTTDVISTQNCQDFEKHKNVYRESQLKEIQRRVTIRGHMYGMGRVERRQEEKCQDDGGVYKLDGAALVINWE